MSRLIRKYKNREGLTLLEVGIVLAVFALIIIGVLTAVSVVNASGRNSRAATQIGTIRSAIGKWSAGGPVVTPPIAKSAIAPGVPPSSIPAMGLTSWRPIVGYLTGSLQALVGADMSPSDATLPGANPWQGSYTICTPFSNCGVSVNTLGPTKTFRYGIKVTGVNGGELPTVVNQLATAGTGDAIVSSVPANNSFVVVYSN